MAESRRDTLKIIGAIGTTCAFPFSADELYGQHVHPAPDSHPKPAGPFKPRFFTAEEAATISRLADLIIPDTDTPGAVAAGVPKYIDDVVMTNQENQGRFREGIAWLDRHATSAHGKKFVALTEAQQIALLTPLSRAADAPKVVAKTVSGKLAQPGEEPHTERNMESNQPGAANAALKGPQPQATGVAFFRMMKSMTADGYYTSQIGLVQELGYKGNTALASFPGCTDIHEH